MQGFFIDKNLVSCYTSYMYKNIIDATIIGDPIIVKKFVEEGCDKDIDTEGRNALHYAVIYNRDYLVDILRHLPCIQDKYGMTPKDYVKKYGYPDDLY